METIIILGKKINVMSMTGVLEKIGYWIENESQKKHWIVLCGMHGIVEGHKSQKFKEIINSAEISLMDGMSLVFLGRLMGFSIKERIAGPDLMKECLKFSSNKGYTNFFLGGADHTLEKLLDATSSNLPKLKVVGVYSPPFREFTVEDDKKIIEAINQKKPNILWVAFDLKKQEEWIYRHRKEIESPVVIGVGAAFKFISGEVKRVPKWIGNMGLEWLWRLFHEPKKIWRRVFIYGPIFLWLAIVDLSRFNNKK